MMLAYLKIGVAVVALVGAFTAGWKVEGWRWDAAEKVAIQSALDHYKAETAQAAKASDGLAATEDQNHVRTVTITKTVDRIVEKPVYRSVCLDADGMRAANAALAGPAAAAGQPHSLVPGADAAR